MFRRTPDTVLDAQDDVIDLVIGEVRPHLRDEPDADPVVEAAAQRLRDHLGSLDAVDQWGRPVAWRQVARIALGDLASPRVRDALTVDALVEATQERPAPKAFDPLVDPLPTTVEEQESPEWRAFFKALDSADRLLGHQAGPAPQR